MSAPDREIVANKFVMVRYIVQSEKHGGVQKEQIRAIIYPVFFHYSPE